MAGWKKLAIGAAVMVFFVTSVILGLGTFYKAPQYEDFYTPLPVPVEELQTREACEAHGGKWVDTLHEEGRGSKPPRPGEVYPGGYCDVYFYAQQEFEAARAAHDRNAAIILGAAAIAAFVIGLFWNMRSAPLGGGLAFGGIILALFTLVRYWEGMNEYVRFFTILAVFVFFVVLALRYGKDQSSNKEGNS